MKARAFWLMGTLGTPLACGARSPVTLMADASGDVSALLDSAADTLDSETAGDGASVTLNSCQLLVLFFVGCYGNG